MSCMTIRSEAWGAMVTSSVVALILFHGLAATSVMAQSPVDPPGSGAQPDPPADPPGGQAVPSEPGGQDPDAPAGLIGLEDLVSLELEQAAVATVQVQAIERTPSAVTRIDPDDLIRTGLDSLAEAMRLVPGSRVAREGRATHAVGIRGVPGIYQRQLLASRDGRPIYTPTFAGIQWAKEDYLLQDLEGIEVVRGPGSTVWGANAVNGIINIVTKSAFDTQGLLLETRFGSHERPMAQIRWGDTAGESTAYRVYAKWFHRDGFRSSITRGEFNDHSSGLVGFRLDSDLDAGERLTLSGEYYNARYQFLAPALGSGAVVRSAWNGEGGHLLARYESEVGEASTLTLSMFLDWSESSGSLSGDARRLAEINGTLTTPIGDDLSLVTGVAGRYVLTSLSDSALVTWPDQDESLYHVSAFAQLTYEWLDDELWVTGGTKLGVNSRSGFEYQPSIRLTWVPLEEHTLWASFSRSVRTPSLADVNLSTITRQTPPAAPGAPTVISVVSGNPDFESEKSWFIEGGWRWRPRQNLFIDSTGFVGIYSDLRAVRTGTPMPGLGPGGAPQVLIPLQLVNGAQQVIPGAELRVSYRPYENWTLDAHYSFLKPDIEADDSLGPSGPERNEGLVAKNVIHLRSYLDLGDDWSWNVAYWWQDGIGGGSLGPRRDGHHRLDTTIQWRPSEGVEVTIGGRNLLDQRRAEWLPDPRDLTTQIEREFWIGVELRF